MTQKILQPFRKFEVTFINQLIKGGSVYLVTQAYERAAAEFDHTKKPILITPYKDEKEAAKHYEHLKSNGALYAGFVDIRKGPVAS